MTLAIEHGFEGWEAMATVFKGMALAEQGREEDGIAHMRRGIETQRALGMDCALSLWRAQLAHAYGEVKRPEEGIVLLTEALRSVVESGECNHEAELYRLKGELLLQRSGGQVTANGERRSRVDQRLLANGTDSEAEACFHNAIQIAQRQGAKSWELRASTSLARLWRRQGKKTEAHQMLSKIYNWFTEGFETKDLQEARRVLSISMPNG